MRLAFLLSCVFCANGATLSAQQPIPNTLTPAEVREGRLLLFDGRSLFGWDIAPDLAEKAVHDGGWNVAAAGGATTTAWGDFRLNLDIEGSTPGKVLLLPLEGNEPQATFDLKPQQGRWSPVAIEWDTSKFARPTKAPPVRIAFRAEGKDGDLRVRNVQLLPLGMKSIFDGKSLAGWKVFPGKKSTFKVNEKGELNVKDGPGDLQTESKHADFLLQLECISNGKHLNSGIFFRCLPDQYQMGYEAQIRNQFTEEPTQKYVLERYDPRTGKSIEKTAVMRTAVDFGTGAIYRRQPARMGVAKDGEWFTLTVHARGNHLATWVNGLQVADWDDFRPAGANARVGRYLKAGHISIQGHDPTTDLSFRNFRIVDLP